MGSKLSSESPQDSSSLPVPAAVGHSNASSSRGRHSFASGTETGQQHRAIYLDQAFFNDNNGQLPDTRFLRARSVVEGMTIPQNGGFRFILANDEQDSDNESESSSHRRRARFVVSQSLPPYISRHMQQDSKCPMCKKLIPADDVEVHFVMCLTKPRVSYNEDRLTADAGECPICLDDMEKGTMIARLPCLCIYHKTCIDEWFVTSQTCPEHPPD